MLKFTLKVSILLACLSTLVYCSSTHRCSCLDRRTGEENTMPLKIASDIDQRLAQFAQTKIGLEETKIPQEIRPVLKKLIEAAKIIDEIYLVQVDEGNPALRRTLESSPQYESALQYFNIMYGPWDRINEHEPFIDSRIRPDGAGFYPTDLTKQAFEAYINSHPQERESLESYFTVIRHNGDSLQAIPYSEFYRDKLENAATLLEQAAALSQDERLQRFLRLRAQSFRTNDYYESDMAWMDLGDGAIEVVIGPYEVYEDKLMGFKASFEAFITIRIPEDSQNLARLGGYLTELENNLPLDQTLHSRCQPKGDESPISVVYELFTSGDTRAGIQTLAFNLPNDERVRQAKGSKKVMLKNVQEAKFNLILLPIAQRLLVAEDLQYLTFDAFFNNTLLHEMAHGLGPGIITLADGTQSDVNRLLRDLYPAIEEAKADIIGLWSTKYLIDHGYLNENLRNQIYVAFLGGFFRSVRFGAQEAHGKANVVQFNYLLEHGAIERTQNGKYRVIFDRIPQVVEELGRDLLTIEAEGNYQRAVQFLDRYGTMPEALTQALSQLSGIPVDIRPEYTVNNMIQTW